MLIKGLFSSLLIALSSSAMAKSVSSKNAVTIDYLNLYSKQEAIYPSHKGLLQVVILGGITWKVSTTCNTSSVVVRNEDSHMISAILAAKAASNPIRLFVDDSQQIGSNECYLRAVGYM